MIGKIINNYIIECKLGDGGMGEVYYAKHNKVDREVAIKVLHSHLFFNENIHNRFKNEANALIKLNHPNIVKIFDYVEQENFACLIMEYINGYTLDDYISKISGPLSSKKASSIICPILDAFQYAHDHNVYHRDIKPANIMISKDGDKVRIMDFGIAKLTDSKNFKTTHANTQLGTPFYMSPEQIKGLPLSRMSDIYSLGVTLFEMVTGKCPYHGITSLFNLQSKIVNQPLPPTNEFYPGVSQTIQNAIVIATQKAPELRFQTCDDFSNYLQERKGTPIPSQPSMSPKISNSTKKINWMAFIIVGLVVLSIVIISSLMPHTPSSFHKENLAVLTSYVTSQEEKSKVTLTGVQKEFLIAETKKVDHLLSAGELPLLYDDFFEKLVKDQNLIFAMAYIDTKTKNPNVIISSKNRDKILEEVSALNVLASGEEFAKYDVFFEKKENNLKPSVISPPSPPVISPPSDSQIITDFWNNLHQQKYVDRVPFESDNQIAGISIDRSYRRMINQPNEMTIVINFRITSIDDESDVTDSSVSLRYNKSGNKYQLTK